jgi:hypothetical protein
MTEHPHDALEARVEELERWARGTPPPPDDAWTAETSRIMAGRPREPEPTTVLFDQDEPVPVEHTALRDPLYLVPLALAVVALVVSLVAIVLAAIAM